MVPTSNVIATSGPDNHGVGTPVPRTTLRPVVPRRTKQFIGCGPVQLQLSRVAALKRQFQSLVFRSELPQETLATCVFGVNPATLWRYLNGAPIPDSTAAQLRAIEHIHRQGSHVTVVYNTGAPSPRWDAMLKQRRRRRTANIAPCETDR